MNPINATGDTPTDLVFSQPVPCSVATKSKGPLSKIVRLDPKTGMVVKDGSECWMAQGTLQTQSFTSLGNFAKGLRKLKPNQCLVHGISAYGLADVTTIGKLEQAKKGRPADALPLIARTKEDIQYPNGPALIMFDHDKARDNAIIENESATQSYRPHELVALISWVMPEIANAGYVSTPSTSACIFDKDGNELRGEGAGSHIYFVVENGQDIPRFLEILGKRLFLAGYGRVEISRSGCLLFRTLVDLTVGSPERLDFAAGAVCRDGLVQKLPEPIAHNGTHLNTALLPDLMPDEEQEYKDIRDRLAELVGPSQTMIKERYVEQEAIKLTTERKISIDEARQVVISRQDHVLTDTDQLYFAHLKGKAVTVADVLEDHFNYENKALADPLEPEYDGGSLTKAKFYWNKGKRPMIRSYAHGLTEYTFERTEASKAKNSRRLKFISSSDLVCTPPKWLIKNHLEEETTATIIGAPATMKTVIVMDMGLCISTGKEWHGNRAKQGPVLYVCGEGKSGITKRIHAWERHHNMKAPLFFVSTSAAQLLSPGNLEEVEKAANEVCETHGKPALLIIDTLNRNFGPGDENSTSDMTAFVQAMDQLRDRLECAVMVVHHTGLADAERGRGNSALRGGIDFEYICKKTGATDEEQAITLTNIKAKDHEKPDPKIFKPVIIDLGIFDEDLNPVTSLILETTDRRPKRKKLSPANSISLKALEAVMVNGVGASDTSWRDEAYALGIAPAGTPDANKQAFNRARTALINKGLVQSKDDLYWLTSSIVSEAGQGDRQGQNGTSPHVSLSNRGTDRDTLLKECPVSPAGIVKSDEIMDDFSKHCIVVDCPQQALV